MNINIKNNICNIFGVNVYVYGIMIAIGILAAFFSADFRAKKYKLDRDATFDLVIWSIVGGLLGAKLLYLIVDIKNICDKPSLIFDSLENGFVVYGGIIGGIGSGYLMCRIKKLNFVDYFDLAMPSVALAQCFGRIGCLVAGCCHGKETTCKMHIIYQHSTLAPNGIKLIPTQLIFSMLNLIHFFILIFLAKWFYKKKIKGAVAASYIMFYSIGRFVMEFFRGDEGRGAVGSLSTSQFISIFTAIFGIVFVITVSYRTIKTNEYNERKNESGKTLTKENDK